MTKEQMYASGQLFYKSSYTDEELELALDGLEHCIAYLTPLEEKAILYYLRSRHDVLRGYLISRKPKKKL